MSDKIFKDKDHRGNKVLNVNTENTVSKPFSAPDVSVEGAVASEGMIDEKLVYNSEVEDLSNAGNPRGTSSVTVGGISAGDQVEGKSVNELLDSMFHPIQSPSYSLPVGTLQITNSGTSEVGDLSDIELTISIIIRDSQGSNGATPFVFDGGGLSNVASSNNVLIDANYVIQEGDNDWSCDYSYLGAAIKDDSHGNPDSTGQFSNGVISDTVSIVGVWPYFVYNDSFTITPTTGTGIKSISDKFVSDVPDAFNLTIDGDSTSKSVMIAVPDIGDTATITVIKDSALPISSSFIRTRLLGVSDATNSGNTQDYTLFSHNNGIGFASDSDYSISVQF